MNPRKALYLLAVLLMACAPLTLAQGTYTQIDVPGGSYTTCWGIDKAGDIVGYFQDSVGTHGFLLSAGAFTTIDDPSAVGATLTYGINDNGKVVGGNQNGGAFLYDIQTQEFTSFRYSHSPTTSTTAYAINNAGTIVGIVSQPSFSKGFKFDGATYKFIAVPGATQTALTAINNVEEALVIAGNSLGNTYFLVSHGKLRKLNVAGTVGPYAVNDVNEITGSYIIAGTNNAAGFVYQNGVRESLRFPAATSTVATALNDVGQVVGFFYDTIGNVHGFLWTPPGDAAKK